MKHIPSEFSLNPDRASNVIEIPKKRCPYCDSDSARLTVPKGKCYILTCEEDMLLTEEELFGGASNDKKQS